MFSWRGGEEVTRESAKLLCRGSNPLRASRYMGINKETEFRDTLHGLGMMGGGVVCGAITVSHPDNTLPAVVSVGVVASLNTVVEFIKDRKAKKEVQN